MIRAFWDSLLERMPSLWILYQGFIGTYPSEHAKWVLCSWWVYQFSLSRRNSLLLWTRAGFPRVLAMLRGFIWHPGVFGFCFRTSGSLLC